MPTHSSHRLSHRRRIDIKRIGFCLATLVFVIVPNWANAEKQYQLGPASHANPEVPAGTVTDGVWLDSQIFPGTKRKYSLYVPAQYDGSTPAALMVFQDGHSYVRSTGDFRVPIVFDNLIAEGAMPTTIAVLIDPGFTSDLPKSRGWKPKPENRGAEYDTVSGDYAEFLMTEILPAIEKDYSITKNPELRAIGGSSSGGICAFSAAWYRPDSFRKVLSNIGSFTDLRGGHNYPPMIRKSDAKPIRVFLQDGSGDLDNQFGNWPLANQQMAKALAFKNYDYKFVYGEGAHNGNHAGSVFPDALRWLWRDWEKETP